MGHQGFSFTPAFSILGLFWFLTPGSTQRPSSIGTCPTETLGREFITSYMENCGNSAQFEVEITGYSAFTLVSVSVSNHTFKKMIVVNQRETRPVQLLESVGINGSTKFSNMIVVKADKDISVVSVIRRQQSLETTVLYPVSSLGNEYYLVTPSSESSDSHPEFSVMTYKESQSVSIYVKGMLHYEKGVYSDGVKLTPLLRPFQGYHFKGVTDLSGTRIVSEHPVAVLVTQMCSCNNTKCNHVFEQLQPTCSWGTTYVIPPLRRQDVNDTVYVMASQNTTVFYQLGGQQENVFLTNGSVLQLPVKLSSPVFVSANVSLQVVYYSRGTAIPDPSHTFLMRVPDVASYCRMYSLNNWKDFKNFALVVANASETDSIIVDNQPVSGVEWNRVPGTEFSWGKSELSTDKDFHMVEHPSSSFGLLGIGVSDTNSYGIPGSCRKNVLPYECNPETLLIGSLNRCQKVLEQGELKSSDSSRELCSFMNSTFANLETMCAQNTTVEEATHQFSSLLDNSTLFVTGKKSQEVVSSAVTLLLQSVELAALAAALRSPKTMQNVTTKSLAIETRLVKGNCSQNEVFSLRVGEETMDIHCNTVTNATTQDLQAVAFISYSNLTSVFDERFLNKEDIKVEKKLTSCHLTSKVVSGVVGGGRLENLLEPVNFTLHHEELKKKEEMVFCVYWKFTAGKGTWTTEGCRVLHTDSNRTICSCDHLSSFAILMSLTTAEEYVPLTVITYVGLTLSLLCLFLAILTFLLCRSIRNVSTSIHLQLCLCLFLADLLFLTAMVKAKDEKFPKVACAVIAGFLHYLFLACFTWMLLEGLHLFLTVRNLKVMNYTSASRFKKRYMYPFGYGFPALIVAISAGLNPGGYGSKDFCWLKVDRDFRWSFLGPVCAIILINLTFFIVTLWILRSKLSSLNEGVSTLKDTRLLTFKAIAQLFILGCTWILGLFQFGSAEMVMAYVFTIVNSLQGAFIFLVHCLLNRQVRDEYKRWIKSTRKPSSATHTSDLSMSANPYSTKTAGVSCDGVHRRAAWDSGTAESSGLSVTS